MAEGTKPYRLYRGGRVKGRVPLQRHSPTSPDGRPKVPAGPERERRERHWGRWIALSLLGLLLLVVAWGATSYLAFSRGIDGANERLPQSVRAQLTEQDGLLTSTPTTIAIFGTDGGQGPDRDDARRSDSIVLLHTDPRRHRLAYLSIPRDLRVEIPGRGTAKINAAFQVGGPTLALRTIKALTGLPLNHVAFVDFDGFRELIDSVGGIEVNVPKPILSNRFDCPFKTQTECSRWDGWRFEKGRQHMNGHRALVYTRVRQNRLDPSETDFARGRRQQQVIQATADKLTSFGPALKLPFIGDDVVKPLATDLSAGQLLQLGWVWFRADSGDALHCRLGGEPATSGGESVILASEDNVATIAMFTGRAAPLPPPKGLPYAPGCTVGG
jgi:polyisoprenyl-teichoic acid--peptidoglycan teichoic acid transferase